MKKTKLYKDITTETIYTFEELKNEYEISVNVEIEIDDDTMTQIINENLWSCGGNLMVISSENNEILNWCNDYSKRMEANRVMTTEEIDESIRELYFAIISNDKYVIGSIIDNLYLNDKEDLQLYNKLMKLLSCS